MSAAQNKALVRRYFELFARHELEATLSLLSDDLVWWIIGKPHLYPNAGLKSKADVAKIFERVDSYLQNWLRLDVRSLIAEDDRVAAEVETHAIAKNGKAYNNTFGFFFVIRNGRISEVREYFDMMHAVDVFHSN